MLPNHFRPAFEPETDVPLDGTATRLHIAAVDRLQTRPLLAVQLRIVGDKCWHEQRRQLQSHKAGVASYRPPESKVPETKVRI